MANPVKNSLQAATIAAAVWFVYSPALHGGWVWDDVSEITKNPVLRDPGGLWKTWFAPAAMDYLPLKTTVQWIQWHLWGDNVTGYHLTNVGLHLLSALLLWHLLHKLFTIRLGSVAAGHERRPTAGVEWVGGLIFAVHPLAVESVAWISELKNVLSLPFLLLAMIAYLNFDEIGPRHFLTAESAEDAEKDNSSSSPRSLRPLRFNAWGWYILSLALFVLAMLCKSSVVMFPAILLLYCWWKRGRVTRADFLSSVPFFAISLALGFVAVWFQNHRAIEDLAVPQGGLLSRLAVAGLAVAFYFSKCAWPVGLLPVYPRWAADPPSLWQFWPWLAIGAALFWLSKQRATWARHALFGLGFFLINLIPVLGFVPMSYMRFSWVADHFAYLPLVGLAGLAAAGIGAVKAEAGKRKVETFLLFALVAVLAVLSRRHAGIFKDESTLWTTTLQRSPDSWLAENNLGNVFSQMGRNAEAMAHFEKAVRLNPGYPEAHDNLGVALVAAGRLSEGIAHYQRAIALKPDFPQAEFNLGIGLYNEGRLSEAMTHFKRALQLKPDFAEAHNSLGVVLTRTGRLPEAISEFEVALQLNPNLAEARHNLEMVLEKRK